MSDDARFDDLSRRAAGGSLSAHERQWLDAFLAAHPERRVDHDWDAAFADVLHDSVARMPARPGWDRTARLLEAEAPQAVQPGVRDRLSQWLTDRMGMRMNLQAMAVAVVVVQAGLIAVLAWPSADKPDDLVRGTAPDATPRGPLLRVSFRADLREAELRQALADVGGEIVGGPGQLGLYLVRVKEGDIAVAAERLRAGGSAQVVEIVRP